MEQERDMGKNFFQNMQSEDLWPQKVRKELSLWLGRVDVDAVGGGIL